VYFYFRLCKRKLFVIVSVGFDEMGQLLIIHFGFVKYLREGGVVVVEGTQ